MLTSNHYPKDVVMGMEAGANDYVFKPFNPVELSARVHAQVRWQHLRQQAQQKEAEAHALTRRTLVEARERADFERQLIGIVSHDLRNPLSAISLAAEVLLKGKDLNERQEKNATRILHAAERASRLVRDLLDFTQARLRGGISLRLQPADIHQLAAAVVEEMQPMYPGRRIELVAHADGLGDCDPDRVSQVIGNLLSNALTYSPPETVVRVETRGVDEAVVLEIHNRGSLISSEALPRLFEPLERGPAHGSRGDRSIGLGLFIVKHIVAAHGGTVSARSTAQEGTTFTVRLPRNAGQHRPFSG